MMAPYEKADLKPGTYPHAWSQLHLGLLHYAIDEYEQAGTIYDEVAESMPASAEKGMALLNAAKCYIVLGEFNEAGRRLGQVDLLPNIDCRCAFGDFVPDSQSTFSFFRYRSADYHFLRQELEKEIEQLPNDKGFQKLQESIRRSRTGTTR
jgi:tetratricopeptide (TPR) repeat protein